MSRRQVLTECGWTARRVEVSLEAGRWQRLYPGVYATFTGPVPNAARAWASVLYAGQGAALAGRNALFLWGVEREWPSEVEVAVPIDRRVRHQEGLVIRLRSGLTEATHPARTPPRLRLEEALLDVADREADVERVLTLVFRAVQQRRTTTALLAASLARRPRHRWRRLLREVLAEAAAGVQTPLERRYLRDVHRKHGLPAAACNLRQPDPGVNRYRDFWYVEQQTAVEVDGREAHPREEDFRDRRRDNRLVVTGAPTLRYGWVEIASDPCGVAVEVVTVLRARGWRGTPLVCRPGCAVRTMIAKG